MDIDEYLREKRNLEAKKELLEAKEKLKDEKNKKTKEFEKEKQNSFTVKSDPTPSSTTQTSHPAEFSPHTLFKRMVFWNIFILIIIIALFATYMFMPKEIELKTNGQETTTPTTEGTGATTPNTNTTNNTITNTQNNKTIEEPLTYPGPEFTFWLEDKDLGPFDERGRLNGQETLIINAPYYNDAIIHLKNQESNNIICYIDRDTSVDQDQDGQADLLDYDTDFIV